MRLFYSRGSNSQLVKYIDVGFLFDPYKSISQVGYLFTCGSTTISCRSVK
jgi:hypothetical protein